MPKIISLTDRQKSAHRNKKYKTKATEKKFIRDSEKNIINRPATLHEILLVKKSASKDQIKKKTTEWACWRTLMPAETKISSSPSTGHIKFWQMMRHGRRTTNFDLTRQKKLWTTKTDNYTVQKKIDLWLDNVRASTEINETDISLLTGLIYHDDRTDIGADQSED